MDRRVYISGPISSVPGGNFEAFGQYAEEIRKMGWEPVNPHDVCFYQKIISESEGHGKEAFWRLCMALCVAALAPCPRVVMLRGWRHSRGARLERKIAKALGKEVIELGGFFGGFFR